MSTAERAGPAVAGLEAAAQRHEAALLQRAMRFTRDRHEAEDLVHDTFERLLRHAGQLRPDTNVLVWMYTVMHNLFLDRCRRRARGPRLVQDVDDSLPAPDPTPPAPPLWAQVNRDQFARAVASLPDDFRVVFQLHAIDGKQYEQIAEQLGIAKNTVGTRLFRARSLLKAALLEMVAGDEKEPQ